MIIKANFNRAHTNVPPKLLINIIKDEQNIYIMCFRLQNKTRTDWTDWTPDFSGLFMVVCCCSLLLIVVHSCSLLLNCCSLLFDVVYCLSLSFFVVRSCSLFNYPNFRVLEKMKKRNNIFLKKLNL